MNCPVCGQPVPEDTAGGRCPSCGSTLPRATDEPPGGPPPPPPGGDWGTPWERRATLGFFPALFSILRACLTEPADFYARMPKRERVGSALGYAILLGWFGAFGSLFWGLLTRGAQAAIFRNLGIEPATGNLSETARMALQVGVTAFAPVFILILVFIWSGILHVVLWVVGGAKEGFEATVRVSCYALGSTSVFYWIPLCGGLVAVIWSLVIQIIGLSRAHEISGGRAAAAVLVPLGLCCVAIVLVAVLFAGAIAAGLGSGSW